MKTTQSKLLLALTMCFSVAAVHASDNNSNKYNSKAKESTKSTTVKAADTCDSVVIATVCGPVQKTVCTSTGGDSVIAAAQQTKDTERSKNDKDNTKDSNGDGKDHIKKEHSNSETNYSHRDSSKDDGDNDASRPYGYHWEQSNSNGVKQRKVTICVRDGGNKKSLDVDDDGHYQGHDQDSGATLGACEDQDDKTGKHTDSKNMGRDVVSISKDAVCGAPVAYQEPKDSRAHHQERDHESDKNNGGSDYSHRDSSKDDRDDKGSPIDASKHREGYRWTHVITESVTTGSGKNKTTTTVDHKQVKVTICHRMGNARVTLDVDDDGWFHGHSKHPFDTEGRCEDQDDKTKKHTDSKNAGKAIVPLATEAACSPTAAAATTTSSAACVAAGGLSAVVTSLGGNTPGVSITPIINGARSSRGGVRNMR
jgi:hypothetical protein